MTAITFDTLLFAKKLKTAGFTEIQAEALAESQAEIIENNLATKQDLKNLEISLKNDMKHLATKTDIINIIKWVAGMLIAQVAVGATLIKILS